MKTIIVVIILSCISSLSNAENINTDLFAAARKGDLSTLERLITEGANVNSDTNGGLTPLHAASASGNAKVVSFLIKKGANVNARANQGVTPLHAASINGHTSVSKTLLANGANVNIKDYENGFSPLHWASWNGHLQVAKLLVDYGADVNLKMKQDQTPLMAAANHNHTSIIQFLISKGANLEAKKNNGQTVLISEAFSGNVEMVHFLLSQGCNVNAKDNRGSTALIGATSKGHNEIVELLLANGANVNARESDGQTALMAAAYKGHIELVKTLLLKGAKIKLKKKDGSSAINVAETMGHYEIVKLLKQGINGKKPTKLLSSPKRWALIIGISKYSDTKIPSLRYASHDAQSFYDWIISPDGGKYPPSQVKLLLDQEATEKKIRNALFVWLAQSIEEDIVIIYFAGHGSPDSPDTPSNLFLLAFDTQYENITTTGFPMWDIETALKRFIKAKKVIVITDACHAGGVGQSYDIARRAGRGITFVPISSNLQNLSKIGDGISIISASDDSQYSQESKKWGGGHGVFTYYLLKGLKGEADYSKDNRVSLGEIIPYLSEQVRRATRNAQTPTVAGRFDPALTIGK